MFTKSKITFVLIAVVAILAIGVAAALAQDNGNQPWSPGGMMGGRGMMGMSSQMTGSQMMGNEGMSLMFGTIAKALGIDQQTLVSELQSGKTLTQLAQEKGVDLATISTALQNAMADHMKALVNSGVLTQAQADAHLGFMQSHWDDMPMFNGQGFGMMSGMWGGTTHHGMMGQGG